MNVLRDQQLGPKTSLCERVKRPTTRSKDVYVNVLRDQQLGPKTSLCERVKRPTLTVEFPTGACVADLVAVFVDTPALTNAGVTLHRGVETIGVTLGDVGPCNSSVCL